MAEPPERVPAEDSPGGRGRPAADPADASTTPACASSATLVVAKESIGFAAAHFSVLETGSETLHGHNYRVAVRATGPVRGDGTVVDFSALKEALRDECAQLDHRMLVPTRCPELSVDLLDDGHVEVRQGRRRFVFPLTDTRLLPLRNTTCECLAGHLLRRVRERLEAVGVGLEVTVEESPGQGATVADQAVGDLRQDPPTVGGTGAQPGV